MSVLVLLGFAVWVALVFGLVREEIEREDRWPMLDSYFARQDELERRRDQLRTHTREAA